MISTSIGGLLLGALGIADRILGAIDIIRFGQELANNVQDLFDATDVFLGIISGEFSEFGGNLSNYASLIAVGSIQGATTALIGMGGSAVVAGLGSAALNRIGKLLGNTFKAYRPAAKLAENAKDAYRSNARLLAEAFGVNPKGKQVHHILPLEFADVFPNSDPNDPRNLVVLDNTTHRAINSRWTAFRNELGGRTPTKRQVLRKLLEIEKDFSTRSSALIPTK